MYGSPFLVEKATFPLGIPSHHPHRQRPLICPIWRVVCTMGLPSYRFTLICQARINDTSPNHLIVIPPSWKGGASLNQTNPNHIGSVCGYSWGDAVVPLRALCPGERQVPPAPPRLAHPSPGMHHPQRFLGPEYLPPPNTSRLQWGATHQ